MSSLPQRKKSAEEIAQLRDNLGVPNRPAPQAIRSTPEVAKTRPTKPAPARETTSTPLPGTAAEKSPSGLPVHRRSAGEIEEIRKREALAMIGTAPNPKLLPAHPAWIAAGYLPALAGTSCLLFDRIHWIFTASVAGLSLLVALSLILRRPISKHHAGFIAMIDLLVIVFGGLHHFPQLQYAT